MTVRSSPCLSCLYRDERGGKATGCTRIFRPYGTRHGKTLDEEGDSRSNEGRGTLTSFLLFIVTTHRCASTPSHQIMYRPTGRRIHAGECTVFGHKPALSICL